MPRLSLVRLRELARKEFRQMFRDPRMVRVIFVAPVVQLLVFGYAVNTDIRDTATLVVDYDRSAESRELQEALIASGYFRIVARGAQGRDAIAALDRGDVVLALEIPAGFGRRLRAGQPTAIQVLADGTRSNTANIARGYVARIVAAYGARATAGARAGPPSEPVDLRARVWYNENLESRVYNVPAVAGVIIMLMSLLLTALAVVRERELGTLEQLMVSPLTGAELLLGKMLPVAAVALIDLLVITGVALLWFDIPLRGSFPLLVFASTLYVLTGLGLGLLISTISRTQQEAFMTMFLVFLPAMLLSGFMFPVSSMPRSVQWLTLLNPIRYYLEIVRGIFLKGVGVEALWPQLLVLGATAVVFVGVAASRFRRATVA